MGNENFKTAVKKLAMKYSNLEWMDEETCPDFDTAIDALEMARSGVFDVLDDYSIGEDVEFAMYYLEEAHGKDIQWQPTPDEIRECCGVWVYGNENTPWTNIKHINHDIVGGDFYNDIYDFRACFNGWTKIEPIPEQCIQKPAVQEERYLVRYPLLAGIL